MEQLKTENKLLQEKTKKLEIQLKKKRKGN